MKSQRKQQLLSPTITSSELKLFTEHRLQKHRFFLWLIRIFNIIHNVYSQPEGILHFSPSYFIQSPQPVILLISFYTNDNVSVTSRGLHTFYLNMCTCFCMNKVFSGCSFWDFFFCVVHVGIVQKLKVGIVPAFPLASCLKPLQCRICSRVF